MAKTDSLLYIKRYLKTFEGVKETECINSTYYNIGDIKIRLSNHSKKQTKVTNKFDIGIVQPINDTKQYIVTIRGSLAMNIMNLTETKEFIRNYILIRQMNKFAIEEYDEETKDKATTVSKIDDLTDITKEHSKLSAYLKHTYKWYSKRLSDNGKKHLRHYIVRNIKNENDLTDLMVSLTESINKKPSKIFSKTEIENLISLITL